MEKIERVLKKILREWFERKGVKIIEGNASPNHIHMLVRIPPRMGISSYLGYLMGKGILMMFAKHAHLKYRYGNTVGRNREEIR